MTLTTIPTTQPSSSTTTSSDLRSARRHRGRGDRCRCGRGVRGRLDNVWCGVPLRRSADACQGERDVLKSV